MHGASMEASTQGRGERQRLENAPVTPDRKKSGMPAAGSASRRTGAYLERSLQNDAGGGFVAAFLPVLANTADVYIDDASSMSGAGAIASPPNDVLTAASGRVRTGFISDTRIAAKLISAVRQPQSRSKDRPPRGCNRPAASCETLIAISM
jgi:hypothetical protein